MGVSEVPLVKQDFMENPRKVVQLDVPFFKPEAHGHLLKLAKVGTLRCLLWRTATCSSSPRGPLTGPSAASSGHAC